MKFQGYYLRFEVTIDFYDRVICLANRVERTFHVTFEKLLLLPRCWVPGQVRVADKFEGYRSPDIYDALVGFCSLVFTGGNKYTRVYLSKLENTSSVSSTPEFHIWLYKAPCVFSGEWWTLFDPSRLSNLFLLFLLEVNHSYRLDLFPLLNFNVSAWNFEISNSSRS